MDTSVDAAGRLTGEGMGETDSSPVNTGTTDFTTCWISRTRSCHNNNSELLPYCS